MVFTVDRAAAYFKTARKDASKELTRGTVPRSPLKSKLPIQIPVYSPQTPRKASGKSMDAKVESEIDDDNTYESILVFNRISNLSWWKRFNGTVGTYRVFEYPLQ